MKRLIVVALTVLACVAGYDYGTHRPSSSDLIMAESPTHSLNPLRLFESPVEAQVNEFRGFHKTFTTQTTTGATASSGLMRGIAAWHTAELIVTGAPATCTYSLQGTHDALTWFTISAAPITCTSTTVGFELGKPAVQVRGNLLTLTGGTAPTVTLKYIGR